MTIAEAISQADKLKPNQFAQTLKIKWLSNLDGLTFAEVLLTHADCPIESFDGYSEESLGTELLIPFPYAEDVYVNYLQAQMARENGETAKYNQSITLYNNAFKMYQSWYNRTHVPIPSTTRFKF